ncbi:MAG TPA: VapC toxin family PIN domain ribonuclease [Propionibacteriaceae bacterium]|nr:VapC toxin family PIN domain ribonuclease [Propionibacteriaceae bacterium]HBY24888.1 VapC toxin family PIN domain ribonuclease [Propionibacteriaceae bacterium]
MIIADTNVVSEVMKAEPSPHVLAWQASIAPADLGICAVTVEEIERGIALMASGRRRRDLERRWRYIVSSYSDKVLAYGAPEATRTAAVLVSRRKVGRPMHLADAMVAGICLAGNHTLATRNVNDFDGIPGLNVVNPFEVA